MTQIATVVYALGILGLFALNWGRNARTLKALWLPGVIAFILAIALVPQGASSHQQK